VVFGGAGTHAEPKPARDLLVLEFVRPAHYYEDQGARKKALDFLAPKIDLTEGQKGSWRARGSPVRTFTYALNHYLCQHEGCGIPEGALATAQPNREGEGLSEEYFLHFAEPTRIRLNPPFHPPSFYGAPDPWFIDVPGCDPAKGEAVTEACRVQVFAWDDTYWVYDLGNEKFRSWMKQRLVEVASAKDDDGIFLDAHGPTFAAQVLGGPNTEIVSGGRLRELKGIRASDPAIDAAYQPQVLANLTEQRAALRAAGKKFLIVNCAAWSLEPACRAQQLAAGGLHSETMWIGKLSAAQIDAFLAHIEELTKVPDAVVDLFGSSCYWGEPSYTSAGNFSSPKKRYLYFRRAAALLVQEPPGRPGHVYFDPTFCYADPAGSGPDHEPSIPGAYLDFEAEWLPAFEYRVGAPTGAATRVATGTVPAGSCDGGERSYVIYQRSFERGSVYVRPQDEWDCIQYGDDTAVTTKLPKPLRLLRDDGKLAPPSDTLVLRNSEAAILIDSAE
jgi:hypothetical protein